MLCECCKEEVGSRRPFKMDMAGTSVRMVCMGCFADLIECSQVIRDASGSVAFAVVSMTDIPAIPVFADEVIVLERRDQEPEPEPAG